MPDRLKVGRAVESVPAHEEEFDQVPRDVATGDVEALGQVREGEPFVHGDDVRDAVSRVDDDAGLEACQRERKGLFVSTPGLVLQVVAANSTKARY